MSGAPPFEKGRVKTGGRAKGTRNKLTGDFLTALSQAFEELGPAAIKIVAKTEPANFLKVIASLVPKELDITDNRLKEFSDDDVDAIIAEYRERVARRASAAGASSSSSVRSGTGETTH